MISIQYYNFELGRKWNGEDGKCTWRGNTEILSDTYFTVHCAESSPVTSGTLLSVLYSDDLCYCCAHAGVMQPILHHYHDYLDSSISEEFNNEDRRLIHG